MNIEQEIKQLREEGFMEGELAIAPRWYIIWEPENIMEYNNDFVISKLTPEFVAFGSSGEGELFVVNPEGEVFCLPAISMESKNANKIAGSISELKLYMERNL